MAQQEASYRRVVEALRTLILSGQLAEGERIPSIRAIADQYGVTTGTATRAIAELRAEGLVIARHGAGVYVRQFRAIPRSSPARLSRAQWG